MSKKSINYILFTTTKCNKCPALKAYVKDNIMFDGVILDENSNDFKDEVKRNNVVSAPTIVMYDGDKEVFRGSELYEIAKFLKNVNNRN